MPWVYAIGAVFASLHPFAFAVCYSCSLTLGSFISYGFTVFICRWHLTIHLFASPWPLVRTPRLFMRSALGIAICWSSAVCLVCHQLLAWLSENCLSGVTWLFFLGCLMFAQPSALSLGFCVRCCCPLPFSCLLVPSGLLVILWL